ncbi:SRPBCC family protein [Streptomyces sp. GC420]|uniref:SRPBCC family protein n=1 Tax=Streptomyces sp. GC420 TaxID=2697568 RepID=UPI001414F615|nr:SRPBCC family protein [Streptomyces sp. GC420]NBM16101.1 ATPase [Streptomyces sp. GC420]
MSAKPTTGIAVRKAISVPLAPPRAFELFTARMNAFWPPEHHIGESRMAEVVVEPRAGGRWYERGVDGSECDWGRVAAWEPPGRVVLVWQISAEWKYDPGFETEVEVTFTEEAPGRTHVSLTHRHLERYGKQAEAMRALFESPAAWAGTLARFAEAAAA